MAYTSEAPFTRDEYGARLAAARAGMAAAGLEVLVACAPENLYYLTGYASTGHFAVQALLIGLEGEPVLITRDLETPNVTATYVYERQVAYRDHHEPIGVLARELRELGAERRRIGLEKSYRYLSIANLERLETLLPQA